MGPVWHVVYTRVTGLDGFRVRVPYSSYAKLYTLLHITFHCIPNDVIGPILRDHLGSTLDY